MVARASLRHCPYCNGMLANTVNDKPSRHSGAENLVRVCNDCGWWFYEHIWWSHGDDFETYKYYEGILKKFDVSSIEVPLDVLKHYLAKRFSEIRFIHPRKFEELCADVFRDYLRCEVILTSYSRDGGVDLYAIQGDAKFAIQLKRRAENITEGIKPIREFIGAMVVQGAVSGIYCTTADRFSNAATDAARSQHLDRRGIRLELVDYKRLTQIFGVSAGRLESSWKGLLRKNSS